MRRYPFLLAQEPCVRSIVVMHCLAKADRRVRFPPDAPGLIADGRRKDNGRYDALAPDRLGAVFGALAQLARASALQAECHRFESDRFHQSSER